MTNPITRRTFVRETTLAAAGIGLAWNARGQAASGAGAKQAPTGPNPAVAQKALPKGKIGNLEISRLILGGNLLTHFTHSRDLQYVYDLAKHYNTDEKILETLATAEAQGIDTVSMHNPPHPMSLLRKYRKERGGKIKWIICPTAPIEPGLAQYSQQVQELIDDGVDAIYLWGVRGDALVNERKIDLIAKAVELVKAQGIPSGVGGHALDVVIACEKNQVPADFYIKTLHHHNYPSAKLNHDSMWCTNPDETIAFMKTVPKPWIAFKTMAAGAIPPKDAFNYVFANGADFCLAGMFDYEIAVDVQTAKGILASLPPRARPWKA